MQTEMQTPGRVMAGLLCPIEAKRTACPVPSFDERVNHYVAKRQATKAAREQQRRDRLKDALDRLALVVPQEQIHRYSSTGTPGRFSPNRDSCIKDSKLEIVESAIEYITRLKRDMPSRSSEANKDYQTRAQLTASA